VRADRGSFGRLVVIMVMACGPSRPATTPTQSATPTLAVLAAESDSFPKAAKAATEFLYRARVKGFDDPKLSKVSMEVVQLSIECVDATVACYAAVGKELKVNQLLFAQIEKGPTPKTLRVTVTLFDVDAATAKHSAVKVFPDEEDATYGIRDVVEEATRP
jgi:hypothetical protein